MKALPNKHRMMTLALAATLAGCAVGNDYERPEQSLPEGYQTLTPAAADVSFADLHWRTVYADAPLQALIDEALNASPDLLIAAARVREAEAVAGVSRAGLLPSVGLAFNTAPTVRPPGERLQSTYSGGVSISWELDLWGRIRRANEAARADMMASEEVRRGVVASLIANVANRYYQLAAEREAYGVTERTAKNQGEALRLIKRLADAGISSEAEVRQQEVTLAATEVRLPTLRQQIAASENALSILLGRTPGAIPFAMPPTLSLPASIPAGLPSSLLERRPDILAAEQQLVAANARVGEAKARFFPTLALTGLFGGISTSASAILGGTAPAVASLGLNAVQPLFAGGSIMFNREATLARLDQALVGYRKAILTGLAEVADALNTYQSSGEVLQVQTRRVESAREALRLADLRYRAGTTSFIEVLDAQRQLFSAETDQVQNLLERRTALSRVYLALGGGWADIKSTNEPAVTRN